MDVRRVSIAPSMMCADFINLGRDLEVMAAGGADFLHVDVMDGHYVPNYTLGPDFCRSLAGSSPLPLDIHLMIENVDAHVPLFAKIPNAIVSFHPEVAWHPLRTIDHIRSCGARAGIAVEPALPLAAVEEMLPHVSLVCVMTVNPGYAGQALIPEALEKVRTLARQVRERGLDILVEVDGNVSWENIPKMVDAGAEVLVAGTSSLFDRKAGLADNLRRMRQVIETRSR
jgi:ribulose-phosphate 3-epimerase